eukprot:7160315-Alexandrium_andersonii.AAC.1
MPPSRPRSQPAGALKPDAKSIRPSTELRNARGASGKRVLKQIMHVNVDHEGSDLRRFRVEAPSRRPSRWHQQQTVRCGP